jgi:uncharacterized protein YcbX
MSTHSPAIQVSQLFYHPVKSLGAIATSSLQIGKMGPLLDRRLMLIDESGKFITQRQCPVMALIQVEDSAGVLTFSYSDRQTGATLACSLPWPDFSYVGRTALAEIWEDEVQAQVIEHDINAWLSCILSRAVQLVFIDDQTHRQVDLDFANQGDQTSFSDGFPLLLVSQASIDFLRQASGVPLAAQNFRPNIVVQGCKPFEEDQWKKIRIAEIEFDIVKPCSRCVIPTLDLKTAQKKKEVMIAMLEHRKQGKKVYVGQNLIHRGLGGICVNQTVEIIA